MNDPGQPTPAPEPQPQALPPAEPAPQVAAPPAPPPALPLSFSQILERVVKLLRNHFPLLAGIAAVPGTAGVLVISIPVGILQYLQFHAIRAGQPTVPELPVTPHFSPGLIAGIVAAYLAAFVFFFVVYAFYVTAACHGALSADAGVRLTVMDCYQLAWERLGRAALLMLLKQLYVLVPILVAMVPFGLIVAAVGATHDSTAAAFFLIPLAVLFYAGAVVWMIFIALRIALAFPACVAEDAPAVESLRRAGRLSQNAKGRIFLIVLIVYAACYILEIVVLLLGIAVTVLGLLAGNQMHLSLHSPGGVLGIALIGLFWIALLAAWISLTYAAFTTALCVIYRDQRLRIDGVALPVAP